MNNDTDFKADDLKAQSETGSTLSLVPSQGTFPDSDDARPLRYGYLIGDFAFLIPEGILTEVMVEPDIYPLPRAPRWLAGMINMRGNVIPLFKLTELPGLGSHAPGSDRVLILGKGTLSVAISINGLPKPLEEQSAAGAPGELPEILRSYTAYAFSDTDTHWYEFNYSDLIQHLSSHGADEAYRGAGE